MRRAFVGAALFALMAAPGFSEQTWTGKISDSMCGATHKMGGRARYLENVRS
jgi:hypothetical protein